MRRSVLVAGALVAIGAAAAFAWCAPTVLVAAPLWIMALCVVTGCRPADDDAGRTAARPDTLTLVPGRPAGHDRRQAAG